MYVKLYVCIYVHMCVAPLQQINRSAKANSKLALSNKPHADASLAADIGEKCGKVHACASWELEKQFFVLIVTLKYPMRFFKV